LMALVDAHAARAAHELGVEQVDLMPALDPSARTYYDFFHATPAGARIITSAIAAAMLRQPRQSAAPVAAMAAVDSAIDTQRKVS
ncbi:MAG: hypothetical protein ACJ731_06750, partial [Vicinamibacterales bacterium]